MNMSKMLGMFLSSFQVFEQSLDAIILQYHKNRIKHAERKSGPSHTAAAGASGKEEETSTVPLGFKEEGLKPLSNNM